MKIRFSVSVLHVDLLFTGITKMRVFSHKEEQEDEANKQRSTKTQLDHE